MPPRNDADESVIEIIDPDKKLAGASENIEHTAAEDWIALAQDQEMLLTVYKQGHQKNAPLEYLFQFTPSEYTVETLQEHLRGQYTPGRYRVQGRIKGRLAVNRPVIIGEESMEEKSRRLQGINNNSNQGDKSNNEMMGMMMTMMNQNQQAQSNAQQRSTELMIQMQGQARDSQDKLLLVMLPLLTQKPDIPKQTDPIDLMIKMKELNPDPMAGFFKGVEMMENIGSNQGEDNEASVYKGLIDAMSPIVQKVANEATQARMPMHPNAPTQAREPMPIQENIPAPSDHEESVLKKHIMQLMLCAKADTDPISVIDMMTALLTEEQHLELQAFLNNETWLTQLTLIYPDVANYSDWFTLLREEYLAGPSDDGQETLMEPPTEESSLTDGLPAGSQLLDNEPSEADPGN